MEFIDNLRIQLPPMAVNFITGLAIGIVGLVLPAYFIMWLFTKGPDSESLRFVRRLFETVEPEYQESSNSNADDFSFTWKFITSETESFTVTTSFHSKSWNGSTFTANWDLYIQYSNTAGSTGSTERIYREEYFNDTIAYLVGRFDLYRKIDNMKAMAQAKADAATNKEKQRLADIKAKIL